MRFFLHATVKAALLYTAADGGSICFQSLPVSPSSPKLNNDGSKQSPAFLRWRLFPSPPPPFFFANPIENPSQSRGRLFFVFRCEPAGRERKRDSVGGWGGMRRKGSASCLLRSVRGSRKKMLLRHGFFAMWRAQPSTEIQHLEV